MSSGSATEVLRVFLRLGLTSFGGPMAHLGYFRAELVEKRKWVREEEFAQLLAISQFLPGPASSQLGFSLGLLRAGWRGAIAAFFAFTLPSAVLLVAFAALLPKLSGEHGQAAVHGLKIVAFAVVAHALRGMVPKLCPDWPRTGIAVAATLFLLLVATPAAQLLVVLGGAFLGMLLCAGQELAQGPRFTKHLRPRTATAWLLLFAALLFGLPLIPHSQGDGISVAEAFYRAGALVFGGGHVVLPLLEDAVVAPGMVSQEDFLAGYGASQAIPGPMFSFAAYLGALIPTGLGWAAGAAIALLFIFLPGFLLMAGVIPWWGHLAQHRLASRAIAGINAAVVGLLGATLVDPILTSALVTIADAVIALVALSMLTLWKRPALEAVIWCLIASVGWSFV